MDRFSNLQEKNQTLYTICTKFEKLFDRKQFKVGIYKPTTSGNVSLRINIDNQISLSIPYDLTFKKGEAFCDTPQNEIHLATLRGMYKADGYTKQYYADKFKFIKIDENTNVDELFNVIKECFKNLTNVSLKLKDVL